MFSGNLLNFVFFETILACDKVRYAEKEEPPGSNQSSAVTRLSIKPSTGLRIITIIDIIIVIIVVSCHRRQNIHDIFLAIITIIHSLEG